MSAGDPRDPAYLDEADVRDELTRVFDVCQGCRRCAERCTAFPTLFELIDGFDDADAGRMTPAEQDRVVDACFQCKLCHLDCPYAPGLHEWSIDVPQLVLRHRAMRAATGQRSIRERAASAVTGRAGLLGRLGAVAPAGSQRRAAISAAVGISSVRLLPRRARQRFSTWAAARTPDVAEPRRGSVTVFAGCRVEHHDVQVGKDLVGVYERNGIECAVADAGCCGAVWLHAGDLGRFSAAATTTVRTLAAHLRAAGGDVVVVVPEPTCGHVLRHEVPVHVADADRADALLVADRTRDAVEHLVSLHGREGGGGLDTRFDGEVPTTVAYHVPCHLRAQRVGVPARDLMALTGAEVRLIERCSGNDGAWGLLVGHEDLAIALADRLAAEVADRDADVVAGDCSRANLAIAERTGSAPSHPLTVVARAYGIRSDA